jgi:hypothetical protein
MGSGLLNGPVAMLRASSAPISSPGERAAQAVSPDTTDPIVVVAGAAGAGKSSVVNILIGIPPLAPVPDPASADSSTALALAPAGPPGTEPAPPVSSYLLFRHGRRPTAYAYIPGHREPRRIALDELAQADLPPVAGGGQTRPPRRVEINHPGELLRRLSVLDTPGFGALDPAYREVVLDAAERGAGLLFVTTAAQPLDDAALDLLNDAALRAVPVVFAMTGVDAYPRWREAVAASRASLAQRTPDLAGAPWVGLDARSAGTAAGAGPDNVDGVGEGAGSLRRAVLALVAPPVIDESTPARSRPLSAVTVAHTTDDGWKEVLERQVRTHRVAAVQRLAIDLATIHVRCVQALGSGLGCARLPHALDRELHALSVRTTRQLDAAASEIANRVFAAVIDPGRATQPAAEAAEDGTADQAPSPDQAPALDPAVLRRVVRAIRRTLESGDGPVPETDRVLLLTGTSGVAVVSGAGALAGLAAVGAGRRERPIMREIGVGLTAGCYLMWQQERTGTNRRDCRRWLQQAIHVVEVELQRELNRRFADLQEAVGALAADTVDHGVLLA